MLKALITIAFAASTALIPNAAHAQSENPAENKEFMDKWMAELAQYVENKCGDFKIKLTFNDAGFDYSKNPTLGTPTAKDRATAGLYGIAAVCETGDAPSNRLKSKFNAVNIRLGAANTMKLNGKTLDISYSPNSKEPFGKLRDAYVAQLNRL
jgi:hypothetical protein